MRGNSSNTDSWRQLAATAMLVAAALPIAYCLTIGDGLRESDRPLVGFAMQLIGTIYWHPRIQRHDAWLGGFVVNDQSSTFDRIFFGVVAALSMSFGLTISVSSQW